METRAPFVVVGAFVLAAIVAVFGFVYWLHNTGGLGPRTTYHVQFDGSVPGLLVGAGVLFNGIRVGEVTDLGLAPDSPRRVNATISVASTTPVRSDTRVGLEFQGLTGVPVIALEGGMQLANSGPVPTLIAEPRAGQSMTQAARDALRKVDSVLSENSEPLKKTIANLQGLLGRTGAQHRQTRQHRRRPRKDDRRRHAGAKNHLRSARPAKSGTGGQDHQGTIGDPGANSGRDARDAAVSVFAGKGLSRLRRCSLGRQYSQTAAGRLIEGFENYDIAHAPLRVADIGQTDFQLLIDVRRFRIATDSEPTAEIGLSARIVDKNGNVIASRLFEDAEKFDKIEPPAAVAAFSSAFGRIAKDMIGWTVQAL